MELKLLLTSVLLLLVFTHDIQGLPGKQEQSLVGSSNSVDSPVENLQTTSRPVTIRRHLKRPSNCKGSRKEMRPHCLCKQLTTDSLSNKRKWTQRCRVDKHKNKKRCVRIQKLSQKSILQPVM